MNKPTGMRAGEIVNLKWSDVDLKAGIITVAKSKTGKVRRVSINAVVRLVLHDCGLRSGEYVFGYKGRRVKRFPKAWARAVKDAKIPPIRFHDLRHTFGTRLAQKSTHLIHIQRLMGHSRIETTMRYLHADEAFEQSAVDSLCDTDVESGTKVTLANKPAQKVASSDNRKGL
jgi:integrase